MAGKGFPKVLVARRGRPVPRTVLMEALWPDEDEERLSNRLSVALTTVRSILTLEAEPRRRVRPRRPGRGGAQPGLGGRRPGALPGECFSRP